MKKHLRKNSFPLYKINIRQNKVKNEMKLEMDCN